jgi:hypothetical protein
MIDESFARAAFPFAMFLTVADSATSPLQVRIPLAAMQATTHLLSA